MDIKTILAKVRKGEALTDEEKTALEAYDPDKVADSKAAAARKDAEKQRDTLKAQLEELQAKLDEAGNAGKSEVDKLKNQVEKLTKDIETHKAAVTKAEAEKRALVRGTKLDRILGGMKFVDGLDVTLPRLALEKALADVKDDDLDTEDTVKPILEAFRMKNKALLLDDSGGGGGTTPKGGAGSGNTGSGDPMKMTPAEREKDLKKRGII